MVVNALMKETETLAKKVIETCIKANLKLVAAESMTGGLLMSILTEVPDASKVIDHGYIVYSDQSKNDLLGVPKTLIDKESVYSQSVVQSMIEGLNQRSQAHIKVAISGIAGPTTHYDLPIGTVFIGLEINQNLHIYQELFEGDRQAIRLQTITFIFKTMLQYLSV